MATALVNGRVLLDGRYVEGHASTHRWRSDCCGSSTNGDVAAADELLDLAGGVLVPGFIDTQVNGGGGALFNEAPTPETIATIGRAHRAFGTTGFLPTLISDDLSVIRARN